MTDAGTAPALPPPLAPDSLRLGQSTHETTGRKVLTLTPKPGADEKVVARELERMARLTRLVHPHVSTPLGVDSEGRVAWIQPLPPTDLRARIDEQARSAHAPMVSLRALVQELRTLIETVSFAHAQGVTHGAIRAELVRLPSPGNPLLVGYTLRGAAWPEDERSSEAFLEEAKRDRRAVAALTLEALTGVPLDVENGEAIERLAGQAARGETLDDTKPTDLSTLPAPWRGAAARLLQDDENALTEAASFLKPDLAFPTPAPIRRFTTGTWVAACVLAPVFAGWFLLAWTGIKSVGYGFRQSMRTLEADGGVTEFMLRLIFIEGPPILVAACALLFVRAALNAIRGGYVAGFRMLYASAAFGAAFLFVFVLTGTEMNLGKGVKAVFDAPVLFLGVWATVLCLGAFYRDPHGSTIKMSPGKSAWGNIGFVLGAMLVAIATTLVWERVFEIGSGTSARYFVPGVVGDGQLVGLRLGLDLLPYGCLAVALFAGWRLVRGVQIRRRYQDTFYDRPEPDLGPSTWAATVKDIPGFGGKSRR